MRKPFPGVRRIDTNETGPVELLALAGSLRVGSLNKKLVKVAAEGARKAGAEVTYIDLADYQMPVFNQDDEDEHGLPENALRLKVLMKASDGFIIASPEYNSSIPGGFKNVLDWASREIAGEKVLECFRGKTAVLMSASPGRLGGLRGLFALREMLQNVGVTVIPDQLAVSQADEAFAPDGSLKEPKRHERVEALGRKLAEVAAKLKD